MSNYSNAIGIDISQARTEAKSTEYAHFGTFEKVKSINFAFSEWTQLLN